MPTVEVLDSTIAYLEAGTGAPMVFLHGNPTSSYLWRNVLLAWPRAMPLGGQPADVVARVEAYDRWLAASSDVPKLLLTFDPGPGMMIGPEMADWCRDPIAALDMVACGPAGHHAPEDQPDVIARAIGAWADRHRLRSPNSTPKPAASRHADDRAKG